MKMIYFLCYIFLFFPMFGFFFIRKTSAFITVSTVLMLIFFLGVIFKHFKIICNFIKKIFKLKLIKYYILFIAYCILISFVFTLLGKYTAPFSYYFWRFFGLFISVFLIAFLPLFSIILNIRLKTLIKLFYVLLFVIVLIGLIQYIAFAFQIKILIHILNFITIGRDYRLNPNDCMELMRIYSTFDEPCMLSCALFISLPLAYNLQTSKYKLWKSHVVNNIFKYLLLPLMLLVVLLSKSPIYIIFCCIELIILYIIHYWKFIKQHLVVIIVTVLLVVTISSCAILSKNLDMVNNPILYRTILSLQSFNDFNNLIMYEQSLANRLLSIYFSLHLFLNNSLFGVGINNLEVYARDIVASTSLPLTHEIIFNYNNAMHAVNLNKSLTWTTLAETGIFGIFLYFCFIFESTKILIISRKILNQFEKEFCFGLLESVIAIFVISFYECPITTFMIWLIFGFVFLFTYISYTQIKKGEINENSNH